MTYYLSDLPCLFERHPLAHLQPCNRFDGVQVGIGGTYLSGTDDILAGVTAQKQFFFGPARSPLAVKLKAQADYNLQTKQVNSSWQNKASPFSSYSNPSVPSLAHSFGPLPDFCL